MRKIILCLLLIFLASCRAPIEIDRQLSETVNSTIAANKSICFIELVDDIDSVLIDDCYHIKTAIKENSLKGSYPTLHNDELLILLINDNWIMKSIVCNGFAKDILFKYEYAITNTIYPADYVFS